jgi:hypothetical protein
MKLAELENRTHRARMLDLSTIKVIVLDEFMVLIVDDQQGRQRLGQGMG